jgi:hypothetical protein
MQLRDSLKRINNAIPGVVKDLRHTAERIARIGEVAETITHVPGGVQDLSKKIKNLTNEA